MKSLNQLFIYFAYCTSYGGLQGFNSVLATLIYFSLDYALYLILEEVHVWCARGPQLWVGMFVVIRLSYEQGLVGRCHTFLCSQSLYKGSTFSNNSLNSAKLTNKQKGECRISPSSFKSLRFPQTLCECPLKRH